MAHGPGGLLATPGLGSSRKKWGKRFKATKITGNLYRGDNGKFQAGGAGGTSTSVPAKGRAPKRGDTLPEVKPLKQPKGRSGGKKAPAAKKPAKTDAERQQEQQAKREAATAAQRATRDQLLTDAGIDANTQGALIDARDGNTLTPANGAKLASLGLAEQSADGSYRLTPAGIGAVDSAMRGDAGRLQTTLSKARDAASKQPKVAEPKKAGGGGGGSAKPEKPTDDEKQRVAQEKRTATARETASKVGLTPEDADALRTARDEGRVVNAALQKLGLVGPDGLATDQGRRALSALERGDIGAYKAAVQDAQSRLTREQGARQRQTEAQVRRDEQTQRRAQADTKRVAAEAERKRKQDEAENRRRERHAAQMDKLTRGVRVVKSFSTYKDAQGNRRWLSRSTTAYEDRDEEIIAEATLDTDSQRMMASKSFGPLRWWHVGKPDEFNTEAPWGPGLDLGWCDYSIVIGRTRVESGTFKSAAIAEQVARIADKLEMSPGFFHPIDQPKDGVFTDIRTFERSLVPMRHGRASNLFTGFTVKEHRMTPDEMERRFKTAISELGLTPDQATDLSQQLVATEKAAQQQGIAFKSTDALPVYTAPDGTQGIIQDGLFVALKAAPPMVEEAIEEVKADPVVEEIAEEVIEPVVEEDMGPEVIGNLTWDEFAAKLTEVLAPVLKMQDMVKSITEMGGELKSMYGGVAQKDDTRSAELATLKSEQAKLNARIAQIEGNQPAVINTPEVLAALKSAGPATPADPTNKPQVPDDPTRPMAGLTAQIMPELYYNGENGWQQRPAN